MTERSLVHSTFTIERSYAAAPAKVFDAWASKEAKAKWFPVGDTFDFREGGREYQKGDGPDGSTFVFDVLYHDIVPNERIVYTYEMQMNGKRISVSVATVDIRAAGTGTKLIVTEMGVYLDGLDTREMRERGTAELMDALGNTL
ncbi:SRPBCC family protein [Devosia sp.]|uniref:SRPBCC family protein n=1 Tax=Devosia sp. TaxID=1871048 RepID=UPI0032679469